MNRVQQKILVGLAMIMVAVSLNGQENPEGKPVPEGTLRSPYRIEVLVRNLHVPWALTFLPDQRIFFTERTGAVRVLHRDALLPEPALTIDVAQENKMGMLGLVADPQFSKNHYLYLAYNYRVEPFDPAHPAFRMRVARYREDHDKLRDPKTLIEDIPAWSNHTGGRLRFARDGTLYITTGDANDPPKAQLLDQYNGKILRINSDGSVPADNPFIHRAGALPEIWSYGHRNPQGLDFQPGAAHLLETEHGPLGGDEVNWITKGSNYGWPVIDHRRTKTGMETALLEFSPSVAPGSASFYRSKTFPELQNNFLIACLRGEGLLRVELNGTKVSNLTWLFHHTFGRIREAAESPQGYLYLSTSQQDPVEGTPRPGDDDDLIVRIVPASLPSSGHPAFVSTLPQLNTTQATGTDGLIARKCAACHGPQLRSGMPPEVSNNHFTYPLDDSGLRALIRNGRAEKGMPPAPDLSSDEIDSLLSYLRKQSAK